MRPNPAGTTLRALVAGHVAVLAGIVPASLLVLLVEPVGAAAFGFPPAPWASRTGGSVSIGLAACVFLAGQAMSLVGLRAVATAGRDAARLGAQARRIGWTVAADLVCGVLLLGALGAGERLPELPVVALLVALVAASVLLSHARADRIAARLAASPGGVAWVRLAPGSGRRLQTGHGLRLRFLGAFAIGGCGLVPAVAVLEAGRPLAALLHAASGAALAVLAVRAARPVRTGRDALAGDAVHLGTLDRSGAALGRCGPVAAAAAALVVAGVAVGYRTPGLGVLAPALLVMTLGVLAVQHASVGVIRTGDVGLRPDLSSRR